MGGRRGRGGCSREPGPGVAPRSWGPHALRPGEVAAAGRAALWRARVPPQAARRRGPAQASANSPLSAGPRPPHMAGSARAGFPAHTNSRLDAFLRRRLPPEVYDAIRAYEPCIVVSDSEKHTFKYVVLSDRLIYLTENPPKSIRRAVALRDVVAIDLIDDYPQFLSPPDRETNQHIRIIYSSTVLKKECEKSKGVKKFSFPFHPSHFHFIAASNNKKVEEEINGPVFWRGKEPQSLDESSLRYHQEVSTPSTDSTFCLPSDLKEPSLHGQSAFRPLPTPSRRSCQSTSATGKVVTLPSCTTNTKEPKSNPNLEKKASELHLYIISTTSSIFLHLKSSWTNYIIKATLLQDPLRAGELSPIGSQKPYRSEEKIKHFGQLKSELFLKDNTLRKILCLITELKVAAQKNFILKRLFWKTSDLFYFLVNKLHEYLPESRDKSTLQNRSQRADELVACIEIMQTLGLMFRETETESSRLKTLAAKKGALFNLLVILISEPQIPKSCPVFDIQLVADSTLVEMSFDAELQNLIKKYTDTATALLYEIFLVFQQGNLGLGPEEFAISWMMSFLQSRPPFITFLASIVKQVVKGLGASFQPLSPSQAVLLYQQFYILKSCLQYSQTLAEYIRNDYREEFRYFIHMPALEKRLPLWYPITQPTTQLFHEVLKLVEQKQCVER
uniref:Chromosome 12 open reading frame 56 n=1 Tax=Felis catus TaxID=9685 RepID=A0ABI7XQG3_FELCA